MIDEMEIQLNSQEAVTEDQQRKFIARGSHFMSPRMTGIYALLFDITEFNALKIEIKTVISEGEFKAFHINYDKAVLRFIYDLFYVILSDQTFFPKYGVTSGKVEISPLEIDNPIIFDIPINPDQDVFFDEERKRLHEFCVFIAEEFVIRHEAYHVLNGHTNYLLKQHIKKYKEGNLNSFTSLDSQTLEMDADSCSFASLLASFSDKVNAEHIPSFLDNAEKLYEVLVFTIISIFTCLPFGRLKSTKDLYNTSHPNARMRISFCIETGKAYTSKYPHLYDSYLKVADAVTIDTIVKLIDRNIVPKEVVINDIIIGESVEGEVRRIDILRNWNNWIPKLEDICYARLAPPFLH